MLLDLLGVCYLIIQGCDVQWWSCDVIVTQYDEFVRWNPWCYGGCSIIGNAAFCKSNF